MTKRAHLRLIFALLILSFSAIGQQNCTAKYGWQHNSSSLEYHFSDSSKANAGDSIINRYWSWGDGTITQGNITNPAHSFPHDSIYNVCLKITTKSGCSSYACNKMGVGSTGQNCFANYSWRHATNNQREFIFSDSSKPAPADSIVSRYWFWGDGSSTDGNKKNPSHAFILDSTYNVCLKITTREGCYSYSCQKITVIGNAPACLANYSWRHATNNQREFIFSDSSKAAPGDSIISRLWYWGDGSSTDGNKTNPSHAFTYDSTYNVCLKITTREGCYSYSCQKITVASGNPTCTANYGWQHGNNSSEYHFYDSSKVAIGDSIIQRLWHWDDGATTDGNLANPVHVFHHDTVYNVCLKIITQKGCYSYSCKKITVTTSNTTCSANYRWHRASNNQSEFTFSDSSKAAPGDSIVSRYWFWGDGVSTDGNKTNPSHVFTHDSTYDVCLKITTREGCYSYSCQKITVTGNPPTCFANYSWRRASNNQSEFIFSDYSKAAPGDSIISRLWYWGDGSSTDGNKTNASHVFTYDSTYNVCLKITTREGCYSYSCQKITIARTTHCEAIFSWEPIADTITNQPKSFIRFSSTQSHGSDPKDTVIASKWSFGDGSSGDGNGKDILHGYEKGGAYHVCLYIKTINGCYDSVCKTIQVPNPTTTHCIPDFTWRTDGLHVNFNSNITAVAAGDSTLLHYWSFDDGSTMPGNNVEASHIYQQPGQYNVCLKIKTASGCERVICKLIVIKDANKSCGALFTYENAGDKKINFNSSSSYTQIPNDYIIRRYWSFGDGTTLGGNEISPNHEYPLGCSYTVCLTIVTKYGCESKWCKQVKVNGNGWADSNNVRLLTLYPNPALNNLFAITWSKHNNVPAQLAVYDVYGILKWNQQVVLPQGLSVWPSTISGLVPGPYIFRLTTQYGVQRKNFLKVN